MPCQTCISFEAKIKRAEADGDRQKARVMVGLFLSHRKRDHPAAHNVVVIDPEYIVWPNGDRWEVVE
jgi:hypothetical protein